QLDAATFAKYPTLLNVPLISLRAASETCEHCHWPENFFGAQLKVITHYGYDEQNTARQLRMLINVGGGSPTTGLVTGIHWHMNIANEVTYSSTAEHPHGIPWVRSQDREDNVA